jgi:hypothetical protein
MLYFTILSGRMSIVEIAGRGLPQGSEAKQKEQDRMIDDQDVNCG